MAMGGGTGKGPQADINVTPLVDIVLVLLIIFMVITPMLEEGPEIQLPKVENADSKEQEEEEDLLISITKAGELFLVDESRTLELLEADLTTEMYVNDHRPIAIQADVLTPYKAVKEVLLVCEKVGAKSVSLRADKDSKSMALAEEEE